MRTHRRINMALKKSGNAPRVRQRRAFQCFYPDSTDLHSAISPPPLLLLLFLRPHNTPVVLARHCALRGRVSVTVHFPRPAAALSPSHIKHGPLHVCSARKEAQKAPVSLFGVDDLDQNLLPCRLSDVAWSWQNRLDFTTSKRPTRMSGGRGGG